MSKKPEEITLKVLIDNVEKHENKMKQLSEDHETAYQSILRDLRDGSLVGVREKVFYFGQGYDFLRYNLESLQNRLGPGFTCKIHRQYLFFSVSF